MGPLGMKNIFYRTNYLLIITAAILVLLSSCGKNGERDNELLYWSSNNTHEIEFAQDIVENWNKHCHQNIVGIIALNQRCTKNGPDEFLPYDINFSNYSEIQDSYHLTKDKKLIYKSSVSKLFPYPY